MSQANRDKEYDLIVIGSGPTGIHAAVQAAKLNKKVCIIEKVPRRIGGCWIHSGTIPSKTLRESLATIHSIRAHVGQHWVERIIEDLQTGKLFYRARKVSSQEEALVRKFIAKNKIDLFEGYGSLDDRFTVRITPCNESSYLVHGSNIVVATGSRPRRPNHIPFDGWRVVDSDEVLSLEQLPKTMLIYGAGVIGCEYACIFAALGVEVTVIDARSRILQYLDKEVGDELTKFMEDLGIKFVLGITLESVKAYGPKARGYFNDGSIQEGEVLFFAAGRVSTTERLGLERLNIECNDRGAIVVNDHFQTNISNIYAAGDAIGPPALAATSSQQGRHIACHAFGHSLGLFPENYPIGVYTIPELSMVGKTEEELVAEGVAYVVGRAYYSEIARGYIRGDSHGIIKLLISKETCKILGIHIVGSDACNIIHIGLGFMSTDCQVQEIINMIFNYPTLAEGFKIAAFNGLNKLFPDGIIKKDSPFLKEKKKKLAKTIPLKKTS